MSNRYAVIRLILLLAIVLTPFTSLRFGVIGMGEVLIAFAIAVLLVINKGRVSIDPILMPIIHFWVLYLGAIFLGFASNVLILGHVSGTMLGAAFDFMAYLSVLFTVLLLGEKQLYTGTTPQTFLTTMFLLWAGAYSALYILSLFTPSIFGLPLRYYSFYSPLVENLHQAAMITSAMPFIMMFIALRPGSIILRLFALLTIPLFALMALESGSTKAFLAVVVGALMSLFFLVLHRSSGRRRWISNLISYMLAIAAVLLFASLYWDQLIELGIQFFLENDGHGAREDIYTYSLDHGLRSFLFGYGPGPHVQRQGGMFWDAHNTTLTVFLQGGLVAVALFAILLVRIVRSLSSSFLLIGALSAVGMYLLGGDILRRLPIWIIITGILYFSQTRARAPSNTLNQP